MTTFQSFVRSAMLFTRRHWLALSIPAISLIFGVGDARGWWDVLRGRAQLARSIERLASPDGFPTIFIYSNETEFRRLETFISARTTSEEVQRRARRGQRPALITRLGGGERVIPAPAGWPQFTSVPGESPVLYSYDAVSPNQAGSDIQWAATLQGVKAWIDRQREQDRALVNVVLIGLLSIALVIHERKTRGRERGSNDDA